MLNESITVIQTTLEEAKKVKDPIRERELLESALEDLRLLVLKSKSLDYPVRKLQDDTHHDYSHLGHS